MQEPASNWFKAAVKSKSNHSCETCNTILKRTYQYESPPAFIPLQIIDDLSIQLGHIAFLHESRYRLIGTIYFGGFHFTCRIIDSNGDIWYNDGVNTGRSSEHEGKGKPKTKMYSCSVHAWYLIANWEKHTCTMIDTVLLVVCMCICFQTRNKLRNHNLPLGGLLTQVHKYILCWS